MYGYHESSGYFSSLSMISLMSTQSWEIWLTNLSSIRNFSWSFSTGPLLQILLFYLHNCKDSSIHLKVI